SLVQWDAATSREISVLRRFGWNRFVLRHLPKAVFRRALTTFLPSGDVLDAELRDDMWECFRKREVRDFIIRMCAGYQGTLPALAREYRTIQTPTLVLWGERERHFPVEHAKRLHAALPNARLSIVPGGTHWMPLSQPSEVASRIRSFMEAVNEWIRPCRNDR